MSATDLAALARPSLRDRQRGLTIIEIAITAAIGAVLAASAIPSFSHLLDRQRLSMTANDINAAMQLARSEAITRGQRVAVAPVNGVNWVSGWRVFVDRNDNGALDGDDLVVREFPATPERIHITSHFSAGISGRFVSFDSNGHTRQPGTNGMLLGRLVIVVGGAVDAPTAQNSRSVCFSVARVRTAVGGNCS